MKNNYIKLVLIIVFAMMNTLSFGQLVISERKGNPTPPSFTYNRPQNCALNTSLLILDYKNNTDKKVLLNKYNLIELNSELFVDAFIKVNNDFDKDKASILDIDFNNKVADFFTARIPIRNLENLLLIDGVISVEIAERANMELDNTRILTNVNQVHNGTGLSQSYSGTGVIVGVIDQGFDYTHPTFRNLNTNQTRISRVWEQTETGTPPSGFNYGNEIIGQTNILSNGYDITTESHATHVTGIAAGSGGVSNSIYKGIAYDSEIVMVPSLFTDTSILNGIQYIFNYATSVNKPAVINMSIGKQIGPHDGSSFFDVTCNNLIGSGKILVGSAGNQGGDNLHLGKNFTAASTSALSFVKFNSSLSTNGSSIIDIWGEVGKIFSVAVHIYNINTNTDEVYTPYINTNSGTSSSITQTYQLYDADIFFPDMCTISVSYEKTNIQNGKPHVYLNIDNSAQDDNYRYVLLEITSTNGFVNSWCNSCNFNVLNYSSPVQAGDSNMTIAEIGGTGNSIISVGAYTSKNSYIAFNGSNQAIGSPGAIGNIASFSSKGPTADGRFKPDITAPGNVIVSSVNHFDTSNNYNSTNTHTVSGLSDGTTNWWFATMEGTSMASPVVTGIIALWLQAYPNLTVADIKYILNNSSITDGFTGTGVSIPNNTWGRGKVNALLGMQLIEQALNSGTFEDNNKFVIYPNPTSSKVFFDNANFDFNEITIYNYLGQEVVKNKFNSMGNNQEVDMSNLSNGVYILKFNNSEISKSVKIIKQ